MLTTHNSKNKRIIKNTLMLYIRMILIMLITLYTSRIILDVLGVEDYGVYNVVGGLVITFSLLSNSLSGAGVRFITFHLGNGDVMKLKSVYSNTVNIQIYLSLAILIVAESLGLWFLNFKLNIPYDRMNAANWVYQFSVLTFIVKLIYVPYNSLIIAYERMSVYAYISVAEVLLQLGVVYLLFCFQDEALIFYSVLTFLVAVIILVVYHIYCKRQFEECYFSHRIEKKMFKEMASFAGWNMIGTSAGVLRNQGVDIIVNLFFGVTVNAARGISNQVNVALTKFTQNFVTAINPQITKSYAANEFERLKMLVFNGSRFSYYLLLFISLPIIIETPYILSLWLKDVPEFAAIFTRLQIITSLVACLSTTNITAMLATGNIRKYQIVVGCISLLNFPISYFVLWLGYNAASTYVVAIFVELLCLVARFHISKSLVGIGFTDFFNNVGIRVIVVTTMSAVAPLLVNLYINSGVLRLICVCFTSLIWSLFIIATLGLKRNEINMILTKLKHIKIWNHD